MNFGTAMARGVRCGLAIVSVICALALFLSVVCGANASEYATQSNNGTSYADASDTNGVQHRIYFKRNDGSHTMNMFVYTEGSKLGDSTAYARETKSLKVPEGQQFLGWFYTDSQGVQVQADENTVVTSGLVLTAMFGTVTEEVEKPEVRVPVYRAYNSYMTQGSSHLFTTDETEYKNAVAAGWTPEGIVFYVSQDDSGSPVYRLYNRYDGSHHYTTDAAERDNLIGLGWTDEGIAWYVKSEADTDVLRGYNPYTGEHLFTIDATELQNAVAAGWEDEGAAFKAWAQQQ